MIRGGYSRQLTPIWTNRCLCSSKFHGEKYICSIIPGYELEPFGDAVQCAIPESPETLSVGPCTVLKHS